MNILQFLTLSPTTGDNSPQTNVIVYCILGAAAVAAIVLGFWKGRK